MKWADAVKQKVDEGGEDIIGRRGVVSGFEDRQGVRGLPPFPRLR